MSKTGIDIEALKRAVLEKKVKEQLQIRGSQQRPAIKRADRDAPLPLSFAQQSLWFIGQLDAAASQAYHLPAALRLIGQLDKPALTAALNRLVERHESLRTHFTLINGQPCQQIAPDSIGFHLSCLDLRSLDAAARAQRVAELTEREAREPFDLMRGPLIRGQLLQLSDDEHVLLFTQHHIISDGWSLGILVRELAAFYRAVLNGSSAHWPALPIQYADYAVWQRNWLKEDKLAEQRDFWRKHLQDAPALLTLPTDRPRPSAQRYAGSQALFHLTPGELNALKTLGQQHNTTLFMTLLAGWTLVLSRLSGQDDIVVGTPVANRTRSELEGVVGFFVNTLALRIEPGQCKTVADLLAQVRERALAAYAHQDLPFEQVVEAVQPVRSLGYNPIFQVMLSLNNTPAQRLTLPGLELSSIEKPQHSTHFDLTLALTETDAGLAGKINYAIDLFDHETIVRVIDYLKNVLTAMTTEITQPITSLTMLPDNERRQLLGDFNATDVDFPQQTLIHPQFEAQAARTPDAIAVLFGDNALTYDELNRRANQLAHHLISLGVRPDDRIAICVERGLDMMVGLLAILKAGAAYLPLDPAYPAERLASMLDDAQPVALLTQTARRETFDDTRPILLLDTPASAAYAESNPDARALGLSSHHLAYVIYTSGSTGKPKGVMVAHRNVLNLACALQPLLALERPSRIALNASIVFDASVQNWLQLLSGHTLVIVPEALRADAQQLWRYFSRHAVDWFDCTPVQLHWLLNAGLGADPAYQPAGVLIGGEAIPPHTWSSLATLTATRFINVYGPTECTVDATACVIDHAHPLPVIGKPLANTKIYILDAQGQLAPLGVAGEIHIGGGGVARGYLHRPELTAERFIPDPFSSSPDARLYKTGDLGRWLPDGNIEYLGRNDFQVKVRGFRIEPGEIEARLTQCPGVQEAVVVAREENPGDTRLVAYLCPQAGAKLLPADLRRQLNESLAEYMVPSAFVTLDAFPLTPNGKLDRKALPAPDQTAVVTRDYEAPQGEVESALAEIWQDLLGLARVGRHDHFFELGGHSLMAVQLINHLRVQGMDATLAALFSHPTLCDLASVLTRASFTEPSRIPVAERNTPLPLSFAQQRLWFIGHLDPVASQAYHLPAALRLVGQLNKSALTAALDSLVARHESLRTHFTLVDGQPCQQISPDSTGFSLSCLDLRSLDAAACPQRVAELTAHEARDPFDLTQDPLVRGQLLQLSDEEHILLLTQHHIISDGWSLGILVRELAALYRAAINGENAHLPPLPIQYADYAVWQRNWLRGETLASLHDFWHNQLQGAPALLRLPSDRPRPSVQRYVGSLVPIHIDSTELTALRALGQQQGTTLFMTLLAAWTLVLSRLSGQDDIVVGTPVANRTRSELEGIVGFFVNTLALRIEPGQCKTVADLLAQVRERALAAYAHQDLPFEQVVEALQPVRSLSYSPIFQVMLSLNNTPAQTLTLPGLELSAIKQTGHSAHFDLTLSLTETESGLKGGLEYATDLFDRQTIVRLAGYLRNVLTAMATNVTRPLASLPMLPDAERRQLLVDFNATDADFPQHALIHQLFENQVERTPDAIAALFEERSLTYDELNRRANRLAHHLISLGVRPDDRIAICVERGLEMIVGLLGILKAGAAYVPLDPAYPAERLAYMLDDAAPVALLTQAPLLDALNSNLPAVLLDEPRSTLFGDLPDNNPDGRRLGLTPRHLAYVIYTSGSTGRPKGVMIEHHSLCNLAYAQIDAFRITANSRLLQFASFSFDACLSEVTTALCQGACLVLASREALLPGDALLNTLQAQAITHVTLPPVAAGALDPNAELPDLKTLVLAGEACPPALVKRWAAGRRMINAYGPTEGTVCATLYVCDAQNEQIPPIGRPIANTRIYILDAQGQPVPLGVAGEIHIGGAGVARGYLNRPELTAGRFIPDPFTDCPDARLYKTGDLGRWLPDGNIEYLGRNDFQVKVRGFRIELGEIETRLAQCPGIREAVVIAREDTPGEKRLVAYLQPQPGVELIPADLRRQLSRHLAEYMLPAAFVTLASFPVTPNGKIDRKALPAPDQTAVVTRSYEALQNQVETALAGIWQDLLGLARVGRHDHFFELGGHSLMIVSLIEQLRKLGFRLDVRNVFAAPILSEMALTIQETQTSTVFAVPPNRIPAGCTAITPDMLPLVTLTQTEIDAMMDTVPGGGANVQDIYPLSPLQEGILFHHRMQEQGDTYLLNYLLAFENRNRLDAFLEALQQVINRHDILRTAVCWQGLNQPVQVVWRHAPLPVNIFKAASQENISAQLQAHTDPRQRRLNLNQAPLLSADITFDPAANEWVLALGFHHLVGDHVTLDLIIAEITLLLQDSAEALPVPLPYRNFIAQILSMPASEHEDYFRTRLADIDAPTAPFGLLKTQEGNQPVNEVRLSLDTALAKATRHQARQFGISPSVLFHVAWAQVLAHTCGRDDVVFGSVLSGRLQGVVGADQVMGMFINTLPVRISLRDRSVLDVVQATYRDLTALLAHEQAPLTLAQRCSGVIPPIPLFSTLFNYRHSQPKMTDNPVWNGMRRLAADERTNYPLTLSVDDLGQGFSLVAQTVATLDPGRVAHYLETAIYGLVEALAVEPQRPIMTISVLPDTERRQVLVEFNATDADFPQHALIHQLFELQAERTPDAIAVAFEAHVLTYAELNRRANQLAHYLVSLGVRPDDRVALCVERCPEMVVALLGILKAGAAYVPLDPGYPAERLAAMLDDAQPVALLTQSAQTAVHTDTVPVVLLDTGDFDACQDSNPDPRALGLSAANLAYVIYTSGSTGKPKGVMNHHRGLCNRLVWMQHAYHLTPDDRVLQKTPFSFDVSVWEFFWPLLYGARLVMARPDGHKDSGYLTQLIEDAGITTLHFVPSMLQQFVQWADSPCDSLKRVICSGEALPSDLQQRFFARFNAELHNLYGPTEAAIDVTYWACRRDDTRSFVPIGRPIANTRIYILDTQGQPVPLGVAGEIHIGGVGVARGYLNRPELTAERFIPDPFSTASDARLYKTGDLGRWLPDGSIEYLGRNDFQVKLRGFRIELGEIEARLTQCPGVQEAVVVAREDSPGDTRLVAYLCPQADAVPDPADLRRQLSQHLAEYMVPSAFVILDAFPLTPNGKLDRKALPVPDQTAVVSRGYEAPQGEVETALADIWQDLLGVTRVGRHDHFFELGGHSLMAVSLIERLRNRGLTLDVRSIFTTPVLHEMATTIHDRQGEAAFVVPPNRIPEGCTAITPDLLSLVTLTQAEIDTVVDTVSGGAANVQDIYPLSPLQEGMLFHYRSQAQGDTYLLYHLIAFQTRERLDAFLDALQQIIDRHDILRTAVCWQGLSQPVQVVWRRAVLPINTFVPASPNDVTRQLQTHTDPRTRRLNLNQAPLLSADIARDPVHDEWLLALGLHHLVCDHMTLALIIGEIDLLLKNRADALPVPLPYRNFIAQTLSVPVAEHEAYFRDQLADVDAPTLPFDLLDIQGKGENIAVIRVPLPLSLSSAIYHQSRQLGISPGVLFHVAWAQVLAHTSRRDDVVFGSVLLGRLQGSAGADRVMGMFINTLPLRVPLAGRSVLDVVQATYRGLTTLLEHEQTPLALAQRCSGVASPMPLFSALLNYRHTPKSQYVTTWDGMRMLAENVRTNYPFTLSVDDKGDDVSLLVQTTAEIDPARIAHYLLTAIDGLVGALETEPQRSILSLSVLPPAERRQLLVEFNATDADFPQHALIHQLFELQAERTPDAIAVAFEAHVLTYAELNRRANRLAHHLLTLGVRPDDRVALCVERSLEMVVALLGILKAGAAYVPLDPGYPAERLAAMLDDAQPVALLTQSALVDRLGVTLPTVILDNPHTVGEKTPDSNPDARALGVTPRHLAYVIYTSGSTGKPKGVMIEHRGLCNLARAQADILHVTPACRLLQFASFSFDACFFEVAAALTQGACLVLAARDALLPGPALLNTLQTQAITHVTLPPVAAGALDPNAELPDLKTLALAGEACPPALVKRWAAGRRVINAYGPTEGTICATVYFCDAQDEQIPPIGRPIANTRIYILDTQGQLAPLGVAGEIHIGGVGVARGYLHRPELTAERFIPDPFSSSPGARLYKTGDLGRWLPDGNIEYLGRNDFQVKVRGFRIELGEIEARLAQCPGILEAVVVAREDTPGEKRLVAYFRARSDAQPTPADLRRQLSQHLAEYMVPSAFVTLDAFPLTPNGKLDRKALPAPDQTAVVSRGYDAPQGEVESALAEIWQDLLGVTRVGRHDNFFELGGHSLMAVSLIERLNDRGWTLDVRGIFSTPVLHEMAAAIQDHQDKPAFVIPPNRIPKGCSAITPDLLTLVTLTQAEIDTLVDTVSGGAANVQDIYPLAPLQEGILFHHLLQARGDTYLLTALSAFDSRERLNAFLDALQQVIDRHDILRTAICWQALSQPVQVVWRHATLSVNTFIPSGEDAVPAQLRAHIDPRRHRIDLRQAPLLAADIAYDPDHDEWLLALRLHHLVSDHITLVLITEEIRLLLQKRTDALPVPPPYRNFIARIRSAPTEAHEAYFHTQLADVDAPTAPFGLLNVQGNGDNVLESRLKLDTTLASAIRAQASRLNVSPGVLFHAAYALVLAHTSGRDDVVFGSVLSGRFHGVSGADRVMGFFINTLPVRISLHDRSVLDLVPDTYRNLMALLEHEQAPLALAQRCSSIEPPIPLFSALLNYRHSRSDSSDGDAGGYGMRLLAVEERTNYPLSLSVDDLGESFRLTARSDAEIDPARLMHYMLTAISNLIAALEDAPHQAALSLPIIPDNERRQLLGDFNATDVDFSQQTLIHPQFEAQAARTPDAIAVLFGDNALTYDELNRRANQLAHHLISLGVRPDDRIAICVERGLDMMVGLLAILKAGAAYLPLDPAYPAERLRYMLDDAQPVALLTQTAQRETFDDTRPILLLDTPASAAYAESNPDARTLGLNSRHLAYVIYTSGSTGKPKGVMVAHRNVLNLACALQPLLALERPSRIALNASIVFDASVKNWLQLLSGHTLVIIPEALRADAQQLWRYFSRHAVDWFDCTPVQLHWLLNAGLGADPDYQPAGVLIGGEAIPPHTWSSLATLTATRFINVYGPTECTVDATACVIDHAHPLPVIGKPLANTKIYILDAQGQLAPLGVAGEIHIGGVGVARGYLHRPELTAERFIPDPFSTASDARLYKTGDLGRWLPDGNIEYLGRNDFQVKVRGFRIEPGEIEARLTQCPGVQEAVVVAREENPGDTRLVAYLCPQAGAKLLPADLRRQLNESLAEYMVPSAFVTLDAFPLTPNGKLDRKALPAPDQTAVVSRSYDAPQGEVETALAQIWQDILGLTRVGRHDRFFEIGGHSLLAVKLLNAMRQQGIELALSTLFAHPTLCDLALEINDDIIKPSFPIAENPVPLSPDGDLPPLFLVHETTGDPVVYSQLAALLPSSLPVYGLHALGIHTADNPPTSIEELADYHIQAIRRIQAHGPYRLAGWSMGGTLAYEIAIQLIDSGEYVDFLGMIDSYNFSGINRDTENKPRVAPVNDERESITTIIKYLRNSLKITDEEELDKLCKIKKLNFAVAFCQSRGWLPAGVTKEDILLRISSRKTILQCVRDHIPPASPLAIHLYTAGDLSVSDDPWRGWQGTVGKDSVIHPVGGTHYTIMQSPLLNQVVDSFSEYLLSGNYTPNIVIQNGTPGTPPLLCIPGAGANASSFIELALSLPTQQPLNALQARGLTESGLPPYVSVEGAARTYLEAIRQTQPYGPYHLLGHSFGGWIAFEIALQLQARGESVANLILVDTDAPDAQNCPPKSIDRIETLLKLIAIYNMLLTHPLALTRSDFDEMTPDEQIKKLHGALVSAGIFSPQMTTSVLLGIVQVMQANLNTVYTPRARYEGLVHLISAKEGDAVERETNEKQWRSHAAQFEMLLMPGNHMTMLSAPQVEKLAAWLRVNLSLVR
ncbi:amino acid adenylation domain-containing protein [Brenneria rubrifaciens]|uniref:amino acid adenylation domain-containing protein n=1 Tax=Brenneria rubrifaciens TaxID=55213 RepID=UPI0036145FEF